MGTSYDLVTFVTDYGSGGGFVGMLHAVVDSIAGARVRIVDIDHSIPPHDLVLGALRMERATSYSRPGVHVGVVDPGVGSARRAVAVEAGGRIFVGPDNGLLVFALEAVGGAGRAVSIENHLLPGRASTFDGRDVFAPAAAHLACGMDLDELGPRLARDELVRLERPAPRALASGRLELRVLQVDGFGNVQFACDAEQARMLGEAVWLTPAAGGEELAVPFRRTFADVPPGSPLLLLDSDGCLALSVNQGRADRLTGLAPGDRVTCRPA